MADYDVKIRISEEGADGAAAKVDGIGKAFKRLTAPIIAARRAVGTLFAALGTVGFVLHGIELIVGGVKGLYEWFGRAQKAAAEMADAAQLKRFESALDAAAKRGKSLADATADALANLKEIARQGSAARSAGKGVQSAQLNYDEQSALAGVTDPQQRQRIKDRFALRRADLELDAARKNAAAERKSIDAQIGTAKKELDEQSYSRTGRETEYAAISRAWREAAQKVKSQEADRGKGNADKDAVENRDLLKKQREKMRAEIDAIDRRTKALNALVQSLEHQKSLIDSSEKEAELRNKATRAEVKNAREERQREREKEIRRQGEEAQRALVDSRLKLEEERALAHPGRRRIGDMDEDERKRRISEDYAIKRAENEWKRAQEKADSANPDDRQSAAAKAEAARNNYEAERQRVANARAERERQRKEDAKKQVEAFRDAAEASRVEAERQEATERIDALSDDLSKGRKSLSSDPETIRAQDRISAMGGFATAGAAAVAGVASDDRSYEEMRKQNELLRQQINELKRIAKNTAETSAVLG